MERLMTVDEVAEYLRLNREVVLRKARKGEIPAVKVGTKTYRFYREQIDEWLKTKSTVKVEKMASKDKEAKKLELPAYPLGAKGYSGREDSPSVITKSQMGEEMMEKVITPDKEQQLLALKKAEALRAKIESRVGKPLPSSAEEIRALREERAHRAS